MNHRHRDHYSYDIWKMKKKCSSVTYVIAQEIPFSAAMQRRNRITEEDKKRIHTIFHSGDLHLWTWLEEGPGYCGEMRRNFEKERIRMQGKEAEAAFLILAPRLAQTAFEGIDAWRKTMKISHIFPIHEWKQYDFTDKYLKERSTETNGTVHRITGENQAFEI